MGCAREEKQLGKEQGHSRKPICEESEQGAGGINFSLSTFTAVVVDMLMPLSSLFYESRGAYISQQVEQAEVKRGRVR